MKAGYYNQGDIVMWRGQRMIYLRPRSDRGPGMVQLGFTGRENRKLHDKIVPRDEIVHEALAS